MKESGEPQNSDRVTRRDFVISAATSLGAVGIAGVADAGEARVLPTPAGAQGTGDIVFPPIQAPSERREGPPPNPRPPQERVGYVVVGLGRIALNQVIPGIAQSKRSRLVGLVSGDAAKAATVARQYGLDPSRVYSYDGFDRIRADAAIEAAYIALPNAQHAEFTVRAARAGKHVLCEKPMATSVADAQRMIDACSAAGRKLMIAYRIQYEPHNRQAMQIVRGRTLGAVKVIEMANGQDVGDPAQWRLHNALSGGGSLPDVGIYCLNTARYLTGEEPVSVHAMMMKTPGDPRFADVPEENMVFQLRFPSGILVNAMSGYGTHRTQRYRISAEDGWAELDPAFPYKGVRMRSAHADGDTERVEERLIDEPHQFATEIDHFSQCIRENRRPYTPGEEGLQDMRIIAALYESARTGAPVALSAPPRLDAYRGDPPRESS